MATTSLPVVAPSRAGVARSARQPSARGWRRYRSSTFYLFVLPWLLGFVGLTLFPMGFALWMSFTNYDGISATTSFVGWANYQRALVDPQLLTSLGLTVLLMVIVVPLSIFIGLLLALLVNLPLGLRPAFRAILYLPSILPVTAGALSFRMLFDQDVGPVNGVLAALHVDAVPWLQGNYAFWLMLAYMLWGVGASMIISLAALQSVPDELTEAAMVDGANVFQRFGRITVPMISPILLFQVITGVIGAIQMFIPALLMGNANVSAASVTDVPDGLRVYMLYVYQNYFSLAEFGYASAMLWLLFVVIVVFTVVVFLTSRRFIYYASGDPADEKA